MGPGNVTRIVLMNNKKGTTDPLKHTLDASVNSVCPKFYTAVTILFLLT